MAFHHVALAARDIEATHAFYTEAMGFELVKSVVAPTEKPGGWAKHLFYDTGGDGLIAFWDIHDDTIGEVRSAISEDLGLPVWVNHLAFAADDLDDLERGKDRWLAHGIDVMEIDHGFCRSMYTVDPNGTLVEWCCDTAPYTEADKAAALAALRQPGPELEPAPVPTFHKAERRPDGVGAEAHPMPADEPVPAT